MSKTINLDVEISSDSHYCEEPCKVKGHIGNICKFAVAPYWMGDFQKYQTRRFCNLFSIHLDSSPNNNKISWLKCDRCLTYE